MAGNSQTFVFDSVLTTTLFNWAKGIKDQIATSNSLWFYLMKKSSAYKTLGSLGERMAVKVRYELGAADAYSGYDTLATTPADGATTAFWTWSQAAVPISISGLEKAQNSGSEAMENLLEFKTKQAEDGIKEFMGKALLQGNGPNTASAITTAYTSPVTGATMFDPLGKIVAKTTTNTVGTLSGSTYSWWKNKVSTINGSTFAAQLTQLDNLFNNCSKGGGGSPDLHIVDQNVYEWYQKALRAQNRFTDYKKADLPFDNVAFRGGAITWDEFVPDINNGTTVQTNTSGTWFMLNSDSFVVNVHKEHDFNLVPLQKPNNQDAFTGHILWYGAVGVYARRKHGVGHTIDTTVAS